MGGITPKNIGSKRHFPAILVSDCVPAFFEGCSNCRSTNKTVRIILLAIMLQTGRVQQPFGHPTAGQTRYQIAASAKRS